MTADLLAACKAIVQAVPLSMGTDPAIAKVLDAIAKAEGRP